MNRSHLFFLAPLCLLPMLFCSVNLTPPAEDPFFLARTAHTSDTIAPYGSLTLRFSQPVADPNSVQLIFTPLFEDYRLSFNATNDTITLGLTLPMAGETRYVLRLGSQVRSVNDSLLLPQQDSIVLVTAPREEGDNHSASLADPLYMQIFGCIETANDTDWFVIADTTSRSFYLKSNITKSSFDLRDSARMIVARPSIIAGPETLTVAPGIVARYAVVYAHNRSNGLTGFYELGCTR
ncbi:MAG: hypothetical protein MUF22_05215 [Chitinispirillaceae bacterium]|jgi:hypothetical protein|nr:hypothetical protein [Chitinispirillaceae bacterium]